MSDYSEILNTAALRSLAPRGLRALLAVAETHSYAAAAERLGLTAPAIHAQIRNLEGMIGAPLLRRQEGGGSVPTEIGAHVCDTARRIDEALLRMSEDVAALRAGRTGRVVLGTVSTAKYFAPLLVRMLQKALPDMEIQLRIGNRQSVIEGLSSGRLDLAVMGRPPRLPDLEAAVIGTHPHVMVAPPGHRLTRHSTTPVEELKSETFILREEGSGTRILATRWMDRLGEGYPYTQIEMDSNETIKQAVMAGLGLALLSQHTVTQELADGRLFALPLPGLPIARSWFLVRLSAMQPSPAQDQLWREILAMRGGFLPK